MGRPLTLEDFDAALAAPLAVANVPHSHVEEEKLKSFDTGYKAGWDDAAKAHGEEQSRLSSEFASNLQALSFTYHEARNAVLSEMEELVRGIVDKVLPTALQPSLGGMILQEVTAMADGLSEIEVEIVVAPENVALIEDLTYEKVAPPLRIREEASLGAGQAFLRIGGRERMIDLDATLTNLLASVESFFDQPMQQEVAHA